MKLADYIQDLQAYKAAGDAYLDAIEGQASAIEASWLRGRLRAKGAILEAKYPLEDRLRLSLEALKESA